MEVAISRFFSYMRDVVLGMAKVKKLRILGCCYQFDKIDK